MRKIEFILYILINEECSADYEEYFKTTENNFKVIIQFKEL